MKDLISSWWNLGWPNCWVIQGGKTTEISQEWELSQTHTREWHHL